MTEEIWITGIGLVTSIGIGRESFWSAACAGTSGTVRLADPLFEMEQIRCQIGAPIKGFDPIARGIPAKEVKLLDLVTQYSLAAAREAVLDAGFAIDDVNPRKGLQRLLEVDSERLAAIIGSGIGGISSMVEGALNWHTTRRRSSLNRYNLPMVIPNAPAASIAIRYQAKAECKAISTACAAGTMALGDGARLIEAGEADVVLAGGADAVLPAPELYGLLGFDLLRTMSKRNDDPQRASRPFDRDRDGFVLADGAAVLVLERAAHAKARGATAYAQIAGYGCTCDATSMMQLEQTGGQIERAMRKALSSASLETTDIDYINAHGTSTLQNDRVESQVIQRTFGRHAESLFVTSTKSMTGHSIGASGAIEAAATALTIRHGVIPPTINLEHPDPECTLNYLPHGQEAHAVHTALSNSYGFGGHNACLVLQRV